MRAARKNAALALGPVFGGAASAIKGLTGGFWSDLTSTTLHTGAGDINVGKAGKAVTDLAKGVAKSVGNVAAATVKNMLTGLDKV